MDSLICHVMPTYSCNQHCPYCYLPAVKSMKPLSLTVLEERFEEIETRYSLERINIYGGEISLLPDDYLSRLFSLCREHCASISAITNLSHPDIIEKFPEADWCVSVNDERPNNDWVMQYLLTHEHKHITLSQVVTPSVIKAGAEKTLQLDSMLGGKVEFLRYCPSDNNEMWKLGNIYFEDFILKILDCYKNFPIEIQNLSDLKDCVEGRYNAFADSNVFIQPGGEISCVAYHGSREYFKALKSIDELRQVVEEEKKAFAAQCASCKYWGHCYAEHMRKHEKGDSCCGLKKLLKHYEENIYQND